MIIETFIGNIEINIQRDFVNNNNTKIIIEYPTFFHDYIMKIVEELFQNCQIKKEIVRRYRSYHNKNRRIITINCQEKNSKKIEEKIRIIQRRFKLFEYTRKLLVIYYSRHRLYVLTKIGKYFTVIFLLYLEYKENRKPANEFVKLSDRHYIKVMKFEKEIDEDKLYEYALNLLKRSI